MSHGVKRRLAAGLRRSSLLRWFMRIAAWLIAPRQSVGAVGAVFDDRGRVLMVEHLFRTDFPWGLPGGWVERGEDPADAVKREIEEELKLQVDVRELLVSQQVGRVARSTHPPHIGLAYYCRLVSGAPSISSEILSVEWAEPSDVGHDVAPFQRHAIHLGRRAFEGDGNAGR